MSATQVRCKVKRPVLLYHGGKWILAPWIISHFPSHRIYVEPYGGAGSVLLRKKRCYAEIYNDLDEEIVNLFNVVRDRGDELMSALHLTPFSRKEFEKSYVYADDQMERARRTVVRSFMGFGSAATTTTKWGKSSKGFRVKGNYSGEYGKPTTGFRANANRSGTTPAHDWVNYPYGISELIKRLAGVVIENRCALKVMLQHDTVNTLNYLDPPYVKDKRYLKQKTVCYRYEMSNEEHELMCNKIKDLKGIVVLSGYDNEIYNDCLPGWFKYNRKAFADGAKERIETIWTNRQKLITEPTLFE